MGVGRFAAHVGRDVTVTVSGYSGRPSSRVNTRSRRPSRVRSRVESDQVLGAFGAPQHEAVASSSTPVRGRRPPAGVPENGRAPPRPSPSLASPFRPPVTSALRRRGVVGPGRSSPGSGWPDSARGCNPPDQRPEGRISGVLTGAVDLDLGDQVRRVAAHLKAGAFPDRTSAYHCCSVIAASPLPVADGPGLGRTIWPCPRLMLISRPDAHRGPRCSARSGRWGAQAGVR